MKRYPLFLLVIFVILLLIVAAVYVAWTWPSTNMGTTTMRSSTPVGAVLYLWYGFSSNGTGGLGSPGWNSSSCPGGGALVDRPSVGFYPSDSNETFRTQIREMQGAGISFAVVSWWGPFNQGEAGVINRATLDLFRYLEGTNSAFKVAIMVDAFPGTCGLPDVSMMRVYDYVEETFSTPYSQWYFHWEGKPLLLFFNPLQPESDANFTIRTIGNRPNGVDWTWWDAPQTFFQGQGGSGVNASNDFGNPVISQDGEVTIVPRVDSYFYYVGSHSQGGYLRFDSSLRLGLYQYEWEYVLGHRNETRLVLIYSWNEYHERTAIEPHDDGNSTLPVNYLLNMTEAYVSMLDSGT